MKDKEGQVLQYTDDWAWGVAPDGKTVCLGTETDIRAILANPKHHPANPTIAQVVTLERQLTGKVESILEAKQIKEKDKRAKRKKGFIFDISAPKKQRKTRKK